MQQGVRVLLRSFRYALALALALGLVAGGANAQDGNLLRDGGFEGTYTNRGRVDLDLPADWSMWIAESPHAEDWMNLPPSAGAYSGTQPSPHGGAQSLAVNREYATFTAAVYQQVSIDPNTNVTASAFAFLRTCKLPSGATTCTSTSDSNAYARIGIDPNGGTNPFDADVVWSANAAPHEEWQQMSVEATSTGALVTVFLYTTQQWPYQINTIFWDDAALTVGGAGGAAAAAPGAATAQPTSASSSSNPPPSERVVHVVQAGETLDSIAFSYGKTREELLAINNISDPRIIQIGQEIIISLPPTPTPTPSPEGFELTLAAITPTLLPVIRDAAPAPVIQVTAVAGANPLDPALSKASICVTFFEDANQNRIQDGGEDALAGGQILLTRDGAPAGTHQTGTDADPYCFTDLMPGSYDLQGVAPSGYGLTTPDQLHVSSYAGAQINVAFGAAEGVATVAPPPADASSGDVATPAAETSAANNGLPNNIGLIVFGIAGIVLIGGMGLTMVLLRRR